MEFDVCVIGGCGHVGLPLGICLAGEGRSVAALDIDSALIAMVNSGTMPFKEEGATELLQRVISAGKFRATGDPALVSRSEVVIFVIGTPVTSHLYPDYSDFFNSIQRYLPHFRDGQLIILRSTVYPGVSEKVVRLIEEHGLKLDVAFCPERISQGDAVKELYELPQIISGFSPGAVARAREFFSVLSDDIVELSPLEAEFAKLFTNTWRYIRFAVANQFYMIANSAELDFYKIYDAITHNYPRVKDMPKAGFAAGPCLYKDTLQLAAMTGNTFFLGHSAMLVNEGMPDYIVSRLKQRFALPEMRVGILGMAFKKDSDDSRESLACKLRNILVKDCRQVLATDPFVKEEGLLPLEEVIEQSDILIIGAPHSRYAELDFAGKEVIDIWDLYGRGGVI
ncbi:MAG: nucleotide sugar dehydrogenase [Proteobacteria bacterium]|nr:nucleotide sugar dehydrogenase [Pseudomonadota bacterium]MBU1738356.1 nucleotide sugar dehydrogenase [Pseudomonadota bacterium]